MKWDPHWDVKEVRVKEPKPKRAITWKKPGDRWTAFNAALGWLFILICLTLLVAYLTGRL